VIMPKLGGAGLYEAIMSEAPDTRFLFMSGHATHVLRMGGQINPSAPFMYKPWTGVELLSRVRETLDQVGDEAA